MFIDFVEFAAQPFVTHCVSGEEKNVNLTYSLRNGNGKIAYTVPQ